MLNVILLDDVTNVLANIMSVKSELVNIIEPDFGLLDRLLRLKVLTRRQYDELRSGDKTVNKRNSALLDLLVSEDQCDKFVKALQRTGQQHVVHVITRNAGQKPCIVISYQ